jgi:hypothetical protein
MLVHRSAAISLRKEILLSDNCRRAQMEDGRSTRQISIALAIAVGSLLLFIALANLARGSADADSGGLGEESQLTSDPTETVTPTAEIAALVNGDAVYSETLVAAIDFGMEQGLYVSRSEACESLLHQFITRTLLTQEFEERDLAIPEDALATAAVTLSVESAMVRYPDYADAISDTFYSYLSDHNISDEEYTQFLGAFAERTLLTGLLMATELQDVPTPTTAEVENAISAQTAVGAMTLMRMSYADEQSMMQAWSDLYPALVGNVGTPFASQFLTYAVDHGQIASDYTNPTESYTYTQNTLLPDYAQWVLDSDTGAGGMIPYVRPDGSSELLLVLAHSSEVPESTVFEDTKKVLYNERRWQALDGLVSDLVTAAAIEIFIDCSMQ